MLRKPRLDIARKMLLGFLPLAVLITALAVYALLSLERLQRVSSGLLTIDVPLIDAAHGLQDALLEQEMYGRQFLTVKAPDLLQAFWAKSEEFHRLATQVRALIGEDDPHLQRLSALHAEYNRLFIIDARAAERAGKPGADYSEVSKMRHRELVELTRQLGARFRARLQERNAWAARFGARAIRVSLVVCLLGILFGFGSAAAITRNISGSIRKLKAATDRVAQGQFDDLPVLASRDELGDLSRALGDMAGKLKHLEELALDANPLTRLPGGRAVQAALDARVQAGAPFAFCLVDLDHFKAFNDRYGYARGNDVIRRVAGILREALERGGPGDFVGHVGGDDFALLTAPSRHEALCRYVVETFDRDIPSFYSDGDRKRGYLVGRTRQGETVSFPVMSISIAVVTNERHAYASHVEVAEVAAELKEFAKATPGSTFIVDRRGLRESADAVAD